MLSFSAGNKITDMLNVYMKREKLFLDHILLKAYPKHASVDKKYAQLQQ